MDLSHDGTIVTCVQAGHTLFNCYLQPSLQMNWAQTYLFPPNFRMAGK